MAPKKPTRVIARTRKRPTLSDPLTANEAVSQQRLIANAVRTLSRLSLGSLDGGNKRDINKECEYPETITREMYRTMYDREGIGTRVVDVWPSESWKMMPDIVDIDDPGTETAFEQAWAGMAVKLCHYMERIDEMSGIGHYGVLLLGFDDAHGGDLSQPVEGLEGTNPDEDLPTRPPTKEHKLLFIRAFDESLVDITQIEMDLTSPRYGQPKMYSITFSDPNQSVTAPHDSNKRDVHWSRVIHVADNPKSSEWCGQPRQQNVYNRLLDLRKTYGGTAEAMWKMGFPGISFESLPGWEDAEFDEAATKDQVERYMSSLQNYLTTRGMTAKPINTPVHADHSEAVIDGSIKNIAITKKTPWRIFAGSEQGHLAATTDNQSWNGRVLSRNERYLAPRLVRRLINRLIWLGILPPPENNEYEVQFPDLNQPTDKDAADRAETLTRAMAKYMDSGVDNLIPPVEFLTLILGLSLTEAKAIEKAARKYVLATPDEGEDDDDTQAKEGDDGDE